VSADNEINLDQLYALAGITIPIRFRPGVKSGWLKIKTMFFSGHVPTKPANRLTMLQRVTILHQPDKFPKWAVPEELAVAASVMSAESLGDPKAYNMRVQLPAGEFFLVDGNGVTVYRSAGYRTIRAALDESYPWNSTTTLTTLKRIVTQQMGCKVLGYDIGLMQCNNDYWKAPLSVGTDPQANVERGYVIYANRDHTWNAWYSYLGGTHLRFMPAARDAVNQLLHAGLPVTASARGWLPDLQHVPSFVGATAG
jgi:hypothetical protein